MRITEKSLVEVFQVPAENAKRALRIIRGTVLNETLFDYPVVKQLYNYDREYAQLLALNTELNCHGVELLGTPEDPYADYLNTGDTYSATIVRYCKSGRWQITSWGDVAESWSYQKRYNEEA